MKLINENQILDEEFRKFVIEEVVYSRENIMRKANELRKHEVYRDKNAKWVMQALLREGYKETTIQQMWNRASNVSIARKIVNKLAQTYVGGVDRQAEKASDQESFDKWNEVLDFDDKMKKADRYRQLFRNTMVQVVPLKCNEETTEEGDSKYKIAIKNLAPWEYDVIPDNFDPTLARVVILTDFVERDQFFRQTEFLGAQGIRTGAVVSDGGDNINQVIANSPSDSGKQEDGGPNKGDKEKASRRFIWWSTNYHFTTNIEGEIIPDESPDGNTNPIKLLPFVNIPGDQDGQFWAQGGEDVVDGSILINKKLTDLNFIQFVQGWGQMVVAAKEVPKKLVGGPDNAFIFNVNDGDPDPKVFFATSNPPINEWLESIRTDVALLLTTNDLSPSSISAHLDVKNVASGIALMIENSEVMVDVMEVQNTFQDKEPEIWERLTLWHEEYGSKQALVEEQQEIAVISEPNVELKFNHIKPPISETDHLNELQLRKGLGLNTMLDLIKKDNPDLTEEEAQAKLEEVIADKKKMLTLFPPATPTPPGGKPGSPGAPGAAPGGAAKDPKADVPQPEVVDKGEVKTK